MKKKGQTIFGLSFGTLFSIIIIIAIVVVAFIAINHFLKIYRCTQVGTFYEDFEDKVRTVWTSGGAEDVFTGNLPTTGILKADIEYVCFGDLSKAEDGIDDISKQIGGNLTEFYLNPNTGSNVYMYPPEETCFPHKNVRCRDDRSDCIKVEKFFCEEVRSGKISVELKIQKGGGGPVIVGNVG